VVCVAVFLLEIHAFYFGWIEVPPVCVPHRETNRVQVVEGRMTPDLASTLAAWLGRRSNPNAIRVNNDHQVEVRPALFHLEHGGFIQDIKAAILLMNDENPALAYQDSLLLCDELEPRLMALDNGAERDLSANRVPWSTVFILTQPAHRELDELVQSY